MCRGRGIRVLHNRGAQHRVDVDGVVLITDELAVEVERASGAGAPDYGDAGSLMILAGGRPGDDIRSGSVGAKTWERHNIAATVHRDAGHRRFACGSVTGPAGAGIWRRSAASQSFRTAARAFFRRIGLCRTGAFSG